MQQDIDQYVRRYRVTGTVHCLGHSLGGAVATLAAEWALGNVTRNVKLYTFGQPRVGLMDFAGLFTQNMVADNIHRVYHTTDPVPMIPIYPYVHAPLPGFGHQIPSNQKILTAEAHDMTGYIDSVKGKGWGELTRAPAVYRIEDGIKEWLQSRRDEHIDNPKTFDWLEKALLWLVEKLSGHLQGIQLALMGVHTFIDKVAWLLAKGIELKDAASKWVILFMEKVMRILGMSAKRFIVNPTKSFFQFLLETLSRRLYELARRAISGQ
jgi:pimeloyl-ACP methyl ester carboxylesterase